MFKKIAHIALAALTVVSAIGPMPLLTSVARAASPNELSYQGRLKDASGVVVADGSYDFTFTLWTALSGGSADWTEDQTLTVTDGYFSAQVGSEDPFLDGVGQETDFTAPLFLEVEVEAETLVPRVPINSVAYAFSSRSIESFANEAAAEADAENFGGRMYYNTGNGNLYVYDAFSTAWVDVTAASGTTMDVAYNAFATDPAIVNVDNAQGQGDLRFALDGGADVLMVNSSDVTFVTFSDAGVTTVDGLFDANGSLTLGDGGDTAAINSSDWDISATGDLTGIGAITADGAVSLGTTLAVTGNTTLTGDLAVNGDDITSDGDLTLTLTGGQLLLADTNVFNIGGVSALAYNAISNSGGAADGGGVAGDNDLYVQDDLEVDGTAVFDGNVDLNGTTTVNAVLTFNASPVFNSTITTSGAIEANGGITTQNGTALTLNSGDVEAVNIGTDTDAESINIGTGAATKTITIGNGTSATVLNFDSGTGGVDFDLLGAMSLDGELVVIGGAADGTTATGDGDLYVVGDFEVDGAGDFGGLLTLGDGGDTVAINSSDWDISTTGDMTGIGSLTVDGLASFSGGITSSAGEVLVSAGNVQLNDNVVLALGSGNEFELVHDGTNSSLTNTSGNLSISTATGSLTIDSDAAGDVINVNLGTGGTFLVEGEDGTDLFRVNDDGSGTEVLDGDLAVSGGFISGANSESFQIGTTDATFVMKRNNAGLVTLTAADDDADANFTISAGGTGAVSLVGGNTSSINFQEFDVLSATGGIAIDDDGNLGEVSVEGTVLDINSLAFVGTGALSSVGVLDIDATGDLSLNSSAGAINIGNDAVAQTINVGTGAAARMLNIGNSTGASGLNFDAGTAGITLDATGTMALNSSGWYINDIGAISGVDSMESGDNQSMLPIAIPVSGADVATHTIVLGIDGNSALTVQATGDGAGGVGARTVSVGVSGAADIVTIGDANADVSLMDADWNISSSGTGTLSTMLLSGGAGLDSAGASVLSIGNSNATGVSLCNSAACDTLTLGVNADADTITIGDAVNDTTTLNGSTVAIDSADWDITAAGVVTGLNQLSLAFPAPADGTNGMTLTNTTSTNSYDLIDIAVTSPTADAGPDTAQGINITLGATNEATDAVKGISVTGTASASGSVFGIELTGGSGASANEWGIVVDSGWDKNIFLYDTTAVFALLDGGVLTFEDDAGTDMFVLADVSTANNHVLSGDANTGLSLSGMTTDISTPVAEDLTIAPGGVGDVIIDTDSDTTLTLNGGGDGTNSLVMTDGSLLISDGDLALSGGDFDVVLDATDAATITSAASTNANPFSVTLTSTGDSNVNAFSISATASNQTDRTVRGLRVNMTSQGTSANDITNGIFVDLLATGGATDKAMEIENTQPWDRDIELQNDEWIGNVTNGTVTFNGDGGSNTSLSIDLDSASGVPTLTGGTGDVVAVNDSLSIGVDGVSTHSISSSGYVISGGNDLYVVDDAGVNGDLFVDGAVTFGSVNTIGVAFTAGDATPAVTGGNYWVVANGAAGAPTTITNFDSGQNGQIIFVRVADVGPGTDISCAGTINCGTTTIALGNGDFLTFFLDDMNNWQLVSMMDDSDNHNAGTGFDLAEWFPSSDALAPGDVVSVDPSANEYVKKSDGAYDRTVVGIVSTNPGITLGEPVNAFASQIALAGRVPVNVTDENGAVAPGDYLVASSTPGFAMKATEAGPVIGIAMEALSGASGQVVAKIANFWYTPAANEASALQGSDASALSSGALSADTIAAGSASFDGNVTVTGHLYAGADAAGRARIVSGDTRVHVAFDNAYAHQPIVNATLRTATDIPGYWWVEEESTTGFDLVLDGTLTQDVEFNWIALGTDGGRVSVSDGSTREINVYVVGAESAPSADPEPVVESESSAEPAEGDATETPVVEGEASEVASTEPEPSTEETSTEPDSSTEEPTAAEPSAEPEPSTEEAPAAEPSAEPSSDALSSEGSAPSVESGPTE